MKKAAVVLIAVVAAGVGAIRLSACRAELAGYWREWSSMQRHFAYNSNDTFGLRQPFLGRRIAAQDPEAAAIADFIYMDYNGSGDREALEDIERLSELSLNWPDNSYFLYETACRLAVRTPVDPQVINGLADRLIGMDPDNGRYYVLKAWAAFYDWREDRGERALDWLEKGFACPEMTDPYERYQDRVCELVDEERPFYLFANAARNRLCVDLGLLRTMQREMLPYLQGLIVNGETARAMRFSDRLQRLAEQSIPAALEVPWELYLKWTPEECPQAVELKWMTPDPQRARQHRLEMLAWKRMAEQLKVPQVGAKTSRHEPFIGIYDHTIPIAAHSFQMTLASLAAVLVFAAVGMRLPVRKSRLSILMCAGLVLLAVGYFWLCRWNDYGLIHYGCGHSHYTFSHVPVSASVLWSLCFLKSYRVYTLAAAWLLFVGLAVVFRKKSRRPGGWREGLMPPAVLLAVGILWITVSRLQAVTLLADVFVLLAVVSLLCIRRSDVKSAEAYGLFSAAERGAQYRGRCLAAGGLLLGLHLGLFVLFTPALARCTTAAVEHARVRWETVNPPRFAVDPNDTAALSAKFETDDLRGFNLQEWLPMVEPADIPGALTVLKERREADPNYRTGGMYGMMGNTQKEYDSLEDLPRAMEACGRDALPALLPFLSDPNGTNMLIFRGRVGDSQAAEQLKEAWQEYRRQAFTGHAEAGDDSFSWYYWVEAMARICPWPESRDAFLECLQWDARHQRLNEPRPWLMAYFNRKQQGELIGRIVPLSKTGAHQTFSAFSLLQYDAELDAKSRESLWMQMIAKSNSSGYYDPLDDLSVSCRPADCRVSDEVLAACLAGRNERLRVLGQRVCRRLGKAADEDTLRNWANDSHFLVRANAAYFYPESISADDPSPTVRLLKRLAKTDER